MNNAQLWRGVMQELEGIDVRFQKELSAIMLGKYEPKPEPTEEEKIGRRCKLALMHSGDIIYVDNETMIGYKSIDDNFHNGLKLPLEVLLYSDFNRWCRGMDL